MIFLCHSSYFLINFYVHNMQLAVAEHLKVCKKMFNQVDTRSHLLDKIYYPPANGSIKIFYIQKFLEVKMYNSWILHQFDAEFRELYLLVNWFYKLLWITSNSIRNSESLDVPVELLLVFYLLNEVVLFFWIKMITSPCNFSPNGKVSTEIRQHILGWFM